MLYSLLHPNWVWEELCNCRYNKTDFYSRKKRRPRRLRDVPNYHFPWIEFYSKFADRLLRCRSDRGPLVKQIHEIHGSARLDVKDLIDKFKDNTRGPIEDIDPFTVISLFNRRLTDANRNKIADELAQFLGVKVPTPDSFPGIPVMNNQNSWFFPYANTRGDDHIDLLWKVFADALKYADDGSESSRTRFVKSFNDAINLRLVKRRLTTGLYWIRPHVFPSLDGKTRYLLEEELSVDVPKELNAKSYLELKEKIKSKFGIKGVSVNSFPELTHDAYYYEQGEKDDGGDENSDNTKSYDTGDIMREGCFLEESRLQAVLDILRRKKNIILQGPPGTGKTWLAKRLAFVLTRRKSDSGVRTFQFHPNVSYEDFVRGWRPSSSEQDGTSGLVLVDGPFLKAVEDAKNEPGRKFVMVIEEINRGNPASIFGEMLTLMEKDKRKPEEALALSYARGKSERVYIPDNLYVIGTMNTADRSIAMVDLALRRRFGFVSLKPAFNEAWKRWMREHGIDVKILDKIMNCITDLNKMIEDDRLLGPHCVIGHSYVTPGGSETIDSPEEWFRQVVESEIEPILEDYWAEDRGKFEFAKKLLQKFGS